jgi:hypothetical protein
VKSEFGYHVIEVTDKTKPSTFDEVKEGIEQQLRFEREAEVWDEWLEEAKTEAEIIYAPGWDPEELKEPPSPQASPEPPQESPATGPASPSASPSGE